MTEPRQHVPGQTALITRRTVLGLFLLRPDDYINQALRYETAKAAGRYDQHIHAACGLSNHVRLVATDTTGDRSDFMRDAMSGTARSRNRNLGRRGIFWGGGQYGDTVVLSENKLEQKLLDTWLKPVKAGLVEHLEDWPGFMILPRHWGETMKVAVPPKYYGRNSPDVIEFTPQPPPGYDHMSLEEVKTYFQKLLDEAQQRIHDEHPDRSYKGAQVVRAENPMNMPDKKAPKAGLMPRYASDDEEMLHLANQQYRRFVDAYETQRQRWLKGQNATFPTGTIQLRKQAPVKCHRPEGDEEPAPLFGWLKYCS